MEIDTNHGTGSGSATNGIGSGIEGCSGAEIDRRIVRFIGRHHVLTLATTAGDEPHCCSLFYAYLPETNCFVVTSSDGTHHVAQVQRNPRVAGAIVLETKMIGKVQGLQLRGRMYVPSGKEFAAAKRAYLTKFPYAAVMDLELWVIEPDYLKLTDNQLGFGKKLVWTRTNDGAGRVGDNSQEDHDIDR